MERAGWGQREDSILNVFIEAGQHQTISVSTVCKRLEIELGSRESTSVNSCLVALARKNKLVHVSRGMYALPLNHNPEELLQHVRKRGGGKDYIHTPTILPSTSQAVLSKQTRRLDQQLYPEPRLPANLDPTTKQDGPKPDEDTKELVKQLEHMVEMATELNGIAAKIPTKTTDPFLVEMKWAGLHSRRALDILSERGRGVKIVDKSVVDLLNQNTVVVPTAPDRPPEPEVEPPPYEPFAG
jgi:hypothetical protein